ncbi:MAG: hypothetical protein Q8L90_12510, partial [Bacteroidota bacterium]|nr:hypothetical protein [Bacteroidota bacterium]
GVFGGTTQTIGNAATGGASGYSYAWLPASNLSSYTIASPIAQCTGGSTTYTVTATDANSCTATSTVVVTRNLVASAGANQAITCAGVAIGGSPTATGGNATYTYSWSPTAGLSSATASNPTSGVCPTATYTVTITDANGCTATSSMVLTKNPCSVTFNYTGAAQTWTVPACVTSITIDANGAQGSTANAGAGGAGGRAQGTLAVTPGATINVYVGGQAGFNGGGAGGAPGGVVGGKGGGASDLRIGGVALANRVVVAGGGGGGGAAGSWSGGAGGVGGGTTGGAGGPSNGGSPFGGQGGSQVAGGTTGGGCGCCAGTAGSLGLGGVGANSSSWSSGGAG